MSDKPIETPENTLQDGEPHPSAHSAYVWLLDLMATRPVDYVIARESLASVALSGNRLGAICSSTLDRLEKNQPVSDRYLLGVAWFIRDMIERNDYERLSKKQTHEAGGTDGEGKSSDKSPAVDGGKGRKRKGKVRPVSAVDGVSTSKRGK